MTRKVPIILFMTFGFLCIALLTGLLTHILTEQPTENKQKIVPSPIYQQTIYMFHQQPTHTISENTHLRFLEISASERLPEVIRGERISGKKSSSRDDEHDEEESPYFDPEEEHNMTIEEKEPFTVYVYTYTINSWDPEELAQACSELNVTRVLLSTKKDELATDNEYEERIANIISALHEKDIIVAGLFLESLEVYSNRGELESLHNIVTQYQHTHISKERYDELNFDLEPHAITEENNFEPYQGHYWSNENGYGINNSNDILLEQTIEILKELNNLFNEKISQANTVWFHERELDGSVAHGKVSRFLEEVDEIILMDYSTNKEDIISQAIREIEDASEKESITICLSTERNAPSSESFYSKTFTEHLDMRKDITEELSEYNSFAGMCNFDFGSLYELYTQ